MTPDPKAIIEEFCIICESAWTDYDFFQSLFKTDRWTSDLCNSIAPLLFENLNRILHENLYIQFCRITDNAGTGKKSNLTTNYIVEQIRWPDEVGEKLREVNGRLKAFRQHIERARSKRIAHVDLFAQLERWDDLGAFPNGAEIRFLEDLQTFVNIAHGYFHGGSSHPIRVAMATDTHQLVRALVKSAVFDRCSKCTKHERIVGVLDYEDRSSTPEDRP